MKKRRTEIVIETHQVWLVRRSGAVEPAWCPECAEWVEMLAPDAASSITRLSVRKIYFWLEARKLHFKELPDGSVLICSNSLLGLGGV